MLFLKYLQISMPDEQLEDNLTMLVKGIEAKKQKQRKSGDLVSLVSKRNNFSGGCYAVNSLK